MEEKWDAFPINICEGQGTITRDGYSFNYNKIEVWQNQQCIFSLLTSGRIEGKIENGSLNVAIDDSNVSKFISNRFSFQEISTNIDRILWSNDLLNKFGDRQKSIPDISSLFFKNHSLSKITFLIQNPRVIIEFYKEDSNEDDLELTSILEQAIAAKRSGDITASLNLLDRAFALSPTDERIYNNRFKVFLGIEKYEEALRNLLILVNYNQIDNIAIQNSEAQLIAHQMAERFNWGNKTLISSVLSNVNFDPSLIWLSLKNKPSLNDFFYRADNLTFYIGHSFVGLNPNIIFSNKIPEASFKNLGYSLLGNPRGEDLRGGHFEGLFLVLGFMIGHMNINSNLSSKTEIVNYFLNHNNSLKLNVSEYLEYIGKLSSKQEIVRAFLNDSTIKQALTQFKNGTERTSIEITDITYRLRKETDNIICFEFPLYYKGDVTGKIQMPDLGEGYLMKEYLFYNPVGYFSFDKEIFSTKVKATILNYCEEEYAHLIESKQLISSIPVTTLSFVENCLVGAFSAEAIIHIKKNKNCSFKANGLDYYIVLADDGDPQVFLDRGYEINGDNCFSIFMSAKRTLFANSEYEEIYNSLAKLKIFSMHTFV